MPGCPSMAMAKARASSMLRPPLPWPRTVTVVSPPTSRQRGEFPPVAVCCGQSLSRQLPPDLPGLTRLVISKNAHFEAEFPR